MRREVPRDFRDLVEQGFRSPFIRRIHGINGISNEYPLLSSKRLATDPMNPLFLELHLELISLHCDRRIQEFACCEEESQFIRPILRCFQEGLLEKSDLRCHEYCSLWKVRRTYEFVQQNRPDARHVVW
jgi:hypothetical protein